jgi:hypothetical protein
MGLQRNWLGQKRIVCDGCGYSLPLWKAVGWWVSLDTRQNMYHPHCPERSSGSYKPLTLLRG